MFWGAAVLRQAHVTARLRVAQRVKAPPPHTPGSRAAEGTELAAATIWGGGCGSAGVGEY